MHLRHMASVILLPAALCSCALYDPERGVFVSSRPQTVSVTVSSSLDAPINLLAFDAPISAPVAEESRVAVAGGAFIPIAFQYRFDAVDQANLRSSMFSSFGDGPSALVDVPKETDVKALKGTVISILFRQAGVNPGAFTTTCTIDTIVNISREAKTSSIPLIVEGSSSTTVASAKNDAIKKYVTSLAGILSSQ